MIMMMISFLIFFGRNLHLHLLPIARFPLSDFCLASLVLLSTSQANHNFAVIFVFSSELVGLDSMWSCPISGLIFPPWVLGNYLPNQNHCCLLLEFVELCHAKCFLECLLFAWFEHHLEWVYVLSVFLEEYQWIGASLFPWVRLAAFA